jgi:hypothetical protein
MKITPKMITLFVLGAVTAGMAVVAPAGMPAFALALVAGTVVGQMSDHRWLQLLLIAAMACGVAHATDCNLAVKHGAWLYEAMCALPPH